MLNLWHLWHVAEWTNQLIQPSSKEAKWRSPYSGWIFGYQFPLFPFSHFHLEPVKLGIGHKRKDKISKLKSTSTTMVSHDINSNIGKLGLQRRGRIQCWSHHKTVSSSPLRPMDLPASMALALLSLLSFCFLKGRMGDMPVRPQMNHLAQEVSDSCMATHRTGQGEKAPGVLSPGLSSCSEQTLPGLVITVDAMALPHAYALSRDPGHCTAWLALLPRDGSCVL